MKKINLLFAALLAPLAAGLLPLASFGATVVMQLAIQLEVMGRENDLAGGLAHYPVLARATRALIDMMETRFADLRTEPKP